MREIAITITEAQEREVLRYLKIRKSRKEETYDYEIRKTTAEQILSEQLLDIGCRKLISNPAEYTYLLKKQNYRILECHKNEYNTVIIIGANTEYFLENVYEKNSTDYITKIIRYELDILLAEYKTNNNIFSEVLSNKNRYMSSKDYKTLEAEVRKTWIAINKLKDSNCSRNTRSGVFRRLIGNHPSLSERGDYLEKKIKQIYTSVSQEQNLTSTDAYIDCVYEECLKQLIEEGLVNSGK